MNKMRIGSGNFVYRDKHTVNPECTCPVCHKKNKWPANKGVCRHFVAHDVSGAMPNRWVFKIPSQQVSKKRK